MPAIAATASHARLRPATARSNATQNQRANIKAIVSIKKARA
jgi:hypothetical protein